MKGYKVFNSDWTCRGFQYEVGKTYEHSSDIEPCNKGFHFCEKVIDCFNYYSFDSDNKVAEIEAIGKVKTEENKSVTDKIKIVREITWYELLDMVNIGKDNTGKGNTGDCNSGNRNSGKGNTGDCNSGNYNTGDFNTGDCNIGNCNSGDYNSGYRNSGNRNSGDHNSGDRNSGDYNSGYRNSGDHNSGDHNSGDYNSGYRNSGNRNSGYRNSGDYNSGNYNSGFFCSSTPTVTFFNKPTNLTFDEAYALKGIKTIEIRYRNNIWVPSDYMSDSEKKEHPEYKTTKGYLKTLSYKAAWTEMWKRLFDAEKQSVYDLPNFDKDIFFEITGIRVKKKGERE